MSSDIVAYAETSAVDPRVQRTRALLLNAFRALLHERGFEVMTVQDIAARAGVNRATFYAHFEDKYALFAWFTRVSFAELCRERGIGKGTQHRNQVGTLIMTTCEFIRELNRMCATSFKAFEPMVTAEVVAEIEQVLSGWSSVSSTKARHITFASWGLYGLVRDWVVQRSEETAEHMSARTEPLIDTLLMYGALDNVPSLR